MIEFKRSIQLKEGGNHEKSTLYPVLDRFDWRSDLLLSNQTSDERILRDIQTSFDGFNRTYSDLPS